jgi:hypothetical protein
LGAWMIANLGLLHTGMGIFFALVTTMETTSGSDRPRVCRYGVASKVEATSGTLGKPTCEYDYRGYRG